MTEAISDYLLEMEFEIATCLRVAASAKAGVLRTPLDLHHEEFQEIFIVMIEIPHIASELNKSSATHCHEDHFAIKTQLWMWQKLISYYIPSASEINKMETAQTTVAMHGIICLI